MNRIRDYTFVLIGVLAVLFVFGGYFLLQDKNSLIDTTQKELAGLDVEHDLLELLLASQKFRGTSNPILARDLALQKVHEESEHAMRQQVEKLDTALMRQDYSRRVDKNWKNIRTTTLDIMNDRAVRLIPSDFVMQTKNIGAMLDLMHDVGDGATLILDPEMASYYLIDLVVNLLPQTIEYVAYNRGNITRNLAVDRVPDTALVSETENVLSQYNLVHLSLMRDAQTILEYLPTGSPPGPTPAQLESVRTYYLSLVTALMNGTAISPKTFFESSTSAIESYHGAYGDAIDALEHLLKKRIAQNKQDRLIIILLLFAVYFSLVSAAYLAISNHVEKEEVLAAKNLKALMEQLERSNVELEHFAHVASHDMKEPLRTISSFSKLMQQKYGNLLDATGQEYLNIMIKASMRMQQMVSDLLEYARISYDSGPRQQFDCEEELKQALESLQQPIKETQARVTWDKLPAIRHHPSQFSRIVQNLISNALKYAREGVPPVVHIGYVDTPDAWQFYVTDNGIGIQKKYLEQIFEPFKRLHTQQQYEGTGIGLALCRKMAERLGGRVWVISTPGKGSTFFFTLMKDTAARA